MLMLNLGGLLVKTNLTSTIKFNLPLFNKTKRTEFTLSWRLETKTIK